MHGIVDASQPLNASATPTAAESTQKRDLNGLLLLDLLPPTEVSVTVQQVAHQLSKLKLNMRIESGGS